MSNPGALLEYNGKRMLVTDWARHLGILPVTLRARLRKGWSLERCMQSGSLRPTQTVHYKTLGIGRQESEYEHRILAQRVLGRPLPPKAEVHHVDGDRNNNTPSNLVICPDHAYHALLHLRTEALKATGNANSRKCTFCKRWDVPENLIATRQNSARHRACYNAAMVALRARRKAKSQPEGAQQKEYRP